MENKYISTITINKRNKLKKMLDKFSTFTWDGKNSWESFGAFIINENREGLKFYNGPSFSNEYTSPQFAKNKEFIGVNFEQQKISFKIGIYWISIEDYRKFLEWLNPYVISKLGFTFAPKWEYQVKLASREESTRYILGYETTENGSEPRYYSEMTLNFEVQGEPCLYSAHEFMWKRVDEQATEEWNNPETGQKEIRDIPDNNQEYQIDTTPNKDWPISSDLPVDFEINLTCRVISETGTIKSKIKYDNENIHLIKELFLVELKNLTVDSSNPFDINLTYSSKDGLLYYAFAGEKYKLLNLLTTTTSGKELVKTLSVNKIQLPGKLTNNSIEYGGFTIIVESTNLSFKDNYAHITGDSYTGDDNNYVQIHSRARTNII